MDLVPDDETEGFSFIWSVQNFSYCLQKKGERLSSPRFKLNLSDTNEWSLDINPRSYEKDDCIGVFLNVHSNGPFPIKVKNRISIRAINGTFSRRKQDVSSIFEKQCSLGHPCFLYHSDLFKKGDDAFLENDTLTLRCRIWKEHPEVQLSGQYYARTAIDVKRISFVWFLENFKELLQNGKKTMNFHSVTSQVQPFTIHMFLSGGVYSERKIQIEIKLGTLMQKRFFTCKLSLLDVEGKASQSVRDEHWFEATQAIQTWCFTFMPVEKILDHEKLYLVNGALSLHCEFLVSSGAKFSEIESIEYCVTNENYKAFYTTVDTGFKGSCKDNLQQAFKEGKFSDLTIRTASSKEFPVHKVILCTRSNVFSAMFEHDTKENRTGVVEIEDLNDDTVSKMLLFAYTDIVEDLEWETASELYFAADKYGIMALKRECSTFLKGNLNISNVCEVLILADMHKDLDLKSAAQDFIMDHATEIINSEDWKKFVQEKTNVAAETLQVLFLKNLKI